MKKSCLALISLSCHSVTMEEAGKLTTLIASGGDLILDVSQDESGPQFAYRVDSSALIASSRYFENLLSDRFSEGKRLVEALDALKIAGFSDVSKAPDDVLPRITIVNVGRIAISSGSTIQKLTTDFLRAVHGLDLAVHSQGRAVPTPPVPNLANLAVVADRFDAVGAVTAFVHRKKYFQLIDAKKPKASEEHVRQKLFVGLLFDHPPWVARYSKHLIIRDSDQWQPGVEEDDTKALWWDLPNGLEEELIRRREYILETMNSIQAHFLKLYTSGERQCKMGYDTSLQCDSFQLGEMIRFFLKSNTLRFQGTIYDSTEPTYYSGDIIRLLDLFRQCPSYQLDQYHSHCGLRTRLMPLIDLIQTQLSLEGSSLDIGICAECWTNSRALYAWALAKRPVLWTFPRSLTSNRTFATQSDRHQRTPSGCLKRHVDIRAMFMATERNWAARDTYHGH